MATLTGNSIASTYTGLLSVSGAVGADTVEAVTDGAGTSTSLSLSQQRATITLGSGAADDFIVDGTTLVVEGDNNRVGIGTAVPGTKLHISDATTNSILRFESTDTTVGSDAVIGSIEFYTNDAFDDGVGAKIMGVASNVNGQVSLTFSTGRPATITERVRIDDAGDVTVSTGNLIIGTAGKGIDFSNQASPAGGMTSELLDHYEEGTWSPVVSDGTNHMTMSGSGNTGYYTKIGNLVTVSGYILTTSIGSASGDLRILGLPFTVANNNAAFTGGVASYGAGLAVTAGHSVTYYGEVNTTQCSLNLWDATTGATSMQEDEWTNDGGIFIGFTYRAA